MQNTNALTSTEIKFSNALKRGIAPYNWLPPELPPLKKTISKRSTYSKTVDDMEMERERFRSKKFQDFQNNSEAPNNLAPDKPTDLKTDWTLLKIPHPLASFKHRDPPPSYKELQQQEAKIQTFYKNLKQKDAKIGTLLAATPTSTTLAEDLSTALVAALPGNKGVEDAYGLVHSFQVLKVAWDWIVCNIYESCAALNEGVKNHYHHPSDPIPYKKARKQYVDLLANLSNHVPEKRGEVDPKKAFGYGKNLGWTFVDPVIEFDRHHRLYLITGVTIVGEWIGYHISSNGIALPHH